MGIHTADCSTRCSLEERRIRLVSKLSALTTRLTQLIEKNHTTFLAAKADCEDARRELADVRRQIHDHKIDHKCSSYSL